MSPSSLTMDRLTDGDLAILAKAGGVSGSREERIARLREWPELTERLLAQPGVFEAVYGAAQEDPLLVVSPYAAFAILLEHAPFALAGLTSVPEWTGHGRRVPVFEAERLREFAAAAGRRLFLADLLASYTHVTSGPVWIRGRGGWHRRRFSELDPVRLAEVALTLPPGRRAPLYRRLGDLSLFLSGVFPDYLAARPLSPPAVERLRRAVAATGGGSSPDPQTASRGPVALFEWLGQRAYRLALGGVERPASGPAHVLEEVAERFREARMVLDLLTDRYLFRYRRRWYSYDV